MAEPSPATAAQRSTSGMYRAVSEPKPILASEVLREELAPLQPARDACRLWLVGVALALTALGVAMRFGVGVPAARADAATMAFSAAGALGSVSVLPFPYALRATVALLIGAVLMVLGLRGAGPLAGLVVDGNTAPGVARLVALTALPAALLFRSRYRAYRRARAVLVAALVATLPLVVVSGLLVADPSAPWLSRVGAAGGVGLVLLALFGFMGQGTTGWGALWAVLIVGGLPLEIALRHFTLGDVDSGSLTYPATALGVILAATLTATGLFQVLATVLAPEARRLSLVTGVRTAEDQNGAESGRAQARSERRLKDPVA